MVQSRTHTCGELRSNNTGERVVLVGWYEYIRKVGNKLGFLMLRDYYGVTQIVIETEEMMQIIDNLNKESTLSVEGAVCERMNKNKKLQTGDIEVVPVNITILSRCIHNSLPLEIRKSKEADESIRLKYRYLDLRNPLVMNKIALRSKLVAELRSLMTELAFLEITTPILTCSSPEGARDYLVPSRNHPGKFYALPQAPQQFKQILMASGVDRYFQIAPCFRDEDARADRSPGEFYQLDMEMAFATQEDVFSIIESVISSLFEKFGTYKPPKVPFVRISYKEAIERYGTDKPDLRIDLIITDITDLLSGCCFTGFTNQEVKAIVVDRPKVARKEIDRICWEVESITNNKVYWFKINEDGEIVGSISKFLGDYKDSLVQVLTLKPGDLVMLNAGSKMQALKAAGVCRKLLGGLSAKYFKQDSYKFCWIVDFPMYELSEETGELVFCHNPFSMPQGGMDALLNIETLETLAYQYDLVCNGVELSSGAVRNHNPEIMIKVFENVGLGKEDVKSKFPAMYNAFTYGAPPHAGIGLGVERMLMLLTGDESIREVIPFPMNKNGVDMLMGAPSQVDEKQLRDIHIKLD